MGYLTDEVIAILSEPLEELVDKVQRRTSKRCPPNFVLIGGAYDPPFSEVYKRGIRRGAELQLRYAKRLPLAAAFLVA